MDIGEPSYNNLYNFMMKLIEQHPQIWEQLDFFLQFKNLFSQCVGKWCYKVSIPKSSLL